jgi:hypothetical protein
MLPVLAAVVLAAAPAAGDVYFEQTTVPYADGKPAGPGVASRVWHGGEGRRLRMEAGGVTPSPALILRLDLGKAYRVEPSLRRVSVMSAERLRMRSHMDAAMAAELMGTDRDTRARTTTLSGERTIAGYPCRGFRVQAGAMVMDLWVTSALPIGMEAFTGFLEWSGAADSLGPLLAEIRSLRGFPLQSRSRVSVLGGAQETLATVTKVKIGPHPAAVFEPPPGFRVVEEGAMP